MMKIYRISKGVGGVGKHTHTLKERRIDNGVVVGR